MCQAKAKMVDFRPFRDSVKASYTELVCIIVNSAPFGLARAMFILILRKDEAYKGNPLKLS